MQVVNPLTAKLFRLVGMFTHMKLFPADAIHNFKLFDRTEVNYFKILLIEVTFYR